MRGLNVEEMVIDLHGLHTQRAAKTHKFCPTAHLTFAQLAFETILPFILYKPSCRAYLSALPSIIAPFLSPDTQASTCNEGDERLWPKNGINLQP